MSMARGISMCLLAIGLIACGGTPMSAAADRSTEVDQTEAVKQSLEQTGQPTAQSVETKLPPTNIPEVEFDPAGYSQGAGSQFIVLDDPYVVPAEEATWLKGSDIVLGVVWGGESRAYPISQMAYHHIANDIIGGEPYLVTY